MKSRETITTGTPLQIVSGVFPVRKRVFSRCFKKFENYFQDFSGFVVGWFGTLSLATLSYAACPNVRGCTVNHGLVGSLCIPPFSV